MATINLDELSIEIASRKRQALKGVMVELLQCFQAEHIPVSEVLDLLAAVLSDYTKTGHAAWDECVGMLERAKDLAQTAEQSGQLETLLEVL